MSELSMMVTITERSKLTTFLSFYRERQVPVQFISLALGTASNETLNYLGLERSDKCVFASFVTDEKWEELRRGLRRELQIDVPGMGIAFTVPLSSIGGRRELQFLTEHQNYQKGEESTMKDTKYELLVVIANHGYSDLIMDAARGAGAAGGCQAEIGSASAMAAAGLAYLQGGDDEQIVNAMAFALKNMLGLTCDPVCGLVEVPCIKRNSAGAVNAVTSAQMALAGVCSAIAPDEVIDTMRRIGNALPACLKETSEGGLATTPSAQKVREKMDGEQ